MIDTHAHLDATEFAADIDEVIARAVTAGVSGIVTVGVDLPSSRAAVAMAQKYATVVAAVGIHPHEAREWGPATAAELRALACLPRVVAIGEIGLDYYRRKAPLDAQQVAFRDQLALASELRLPVIVHDRDAHDDVLRMLTEEIAARRPSTRPAGVLHCFSGDVPMMRLVEQLGFWVSIAGPVTYPKSASLQAVAAAVSADRLVVETDCPFLAPEPFRGKRNEPAYVGAVLARVAELRGETPAALSRQTAANAVHLFGDKLAHGRLAAG